MLLEQLCFQTVLFPTSLQDKTCLFLHSLQTQRIMIWSDEPAGSDMLTPAALLLLPLQFALIRQNVWFPGQTPAPLPLISFAGCLSGSRWRSVNSKRSKAVAASICWACLTCSDSLGASVCSPFSDPSCSGMRRKEELLLAAGRESGL